MKLKTMILAAAAVSVMPIAAADPQGDTEARPYTITFDGAVYPAGLDRMAYPFLAASRGENGQCRLAVGETTDGGVGSLSVIGCSSAVFLAAAEDFVARFAPSVADGSPLTVHYLDVTWNISPEPAIGVQLAAR